jgi:hypothetical protein
LVAAATILVIVMLPVIGAYVVVGESAAMGALIGGMVGFLASMTSGMAVTRRFIPVVVLTATISIVAQDTWWWVLGLAFIAGVAGWFYRSGLYTPMVLAGVAYSIAHPVGDSGGLLAALIFLVVGAANGMVLAHALGAKESVDPVVREAYPAAGTAAVLALTAGLSGVVALLWDNPNGYWLPMTVFIIAMPRPGVDLRSRSRARVLGTLLGVVLAVVVVQFALPVGVPLLLAVVALMVAFTSESLTVSGGVVTGDRPAAVAGRRRCGYRRVENRGHPGGGGHRCAGPCGGPLGCRQTRLADRGREHRRQGAGFGRARGAGWCRAGVT